MFYESCVYADRFSQILRPMSRLGGITYGRTTEALEILRPDFQKDVGGPEGAEKIKTQETKN